MSAPVTPVTKNREIGQIRLLITKKAPADDSRNSHAGGDAKTHGYSKESDTDHTAGHPGRACRSGKYGAYYEYQREEQSRRNGTQADVNKVRHGAAEHPCGDQHPDG